LVATPEEIYSGLEPNHSTIYFENRHECPLIGMQLTRAQLVVAKHIPYKSFEREGIPHLIHVKRSEDFTKTPRGSQG
jgi:hypothetical protein